METITFTAHAHDESQIAALKAFMKALKIKFELTKETDKPYNPEFVAKIQKSRAEAAEGKTVKIDFSLI